MVLVSGQVVQQECAHSHEHDDCIYTAVTAHVFPSSDCKPEMMRSTWDGCCSGAKGRRESAEPVVCNISVDSATVASTETDAPWTLASRCHSGPETYVFVGRGGGIGREKASEMRRGQFLSLHAFVSTSQQVLSAKPSKSTKRRSIPTSLGVCIWPRSFKQVTRSKDPAGKGVVVSFVESKEIF